MSENKKSYKDQIKDTAFVDKDLNEQFELRTIHPEEANQAVAIELICFPPNEACTAKIMGERISVAPELFLVAVEKQSGKIAGFLNGLSTDESSFRDEFFTNVQLHNTNGKISLSWDWMYFPNIVIRDWQRQSCTSIYKENRKEAEKGFF